MREKIVVFNTIQSVDSNNNTNDDDNIVYTVEALAARSFDSQLVPPNASPPIFELNPSSVEQISRLSEQKCVPKNSKCIENDTNSMKL